MPKRLTRSPRRWRSTSGISFCEFYPVRKTDAPAVGLAADPARCPHPAWDFRSGNGEVACSRYCGRVARWYWWSNRGKVCKDCGRGSRWPGGQFTADRKGRVRMPSARGLVQFVGWVQCFGVAHDSRQPRFEPGCWGAAQTLTTYPDWGIRYKGVCAG